MSQNFTMEDYKIWYTQNQNGRGVHLIAEQMGVTVSEVVDGIKTYKEVVIEGKEVPDQVYVPEELTSIKALWLFENGYTKEQIARQYNISLKSVALKIARQQKKEHKEERRKEIEADLQPEKVDEILQTSFEEINERYFGGGEERASFAVQAISKFTGLNPDEVTRQIVTKFLSL